ncbi:PQQ-binding-like beta-propeller repeat protein [Verrucomicrobiaceae bacterium 227]
MSISRLLFFIPLILHAGEFPAIFHQAPAPLSPDAVTSEWPRFLGPGDNCITPESHLLEKFPATGLQPVFELARGESYASPIIAGGKLLHFHALESSETLDCHHPETGKRLWTFSYPIKYRDRYGFSEGPRTSPVVQGDRIFLIGVTAMLHCLDLNTGKVIWKRNLMEEFSVPQYFFGYGPNPKIYRDKLIINIGGREEKNKGTCIIALNTADGKTSWKHQDEWGASYASPTVATIHGKDVALVIAGGESKPTHGGLLALNPLTGKLYSRFPWRAKVYESVLSSSPLVLPNNQVFISECYEKGGVLLQFDKELQPTPVWTKRYFGMHMMIPQLIDGHLFGFAGRNVPDTQLKCLNPGTGEILWENDMRWTEENRVTGLFRGSFLKTSKRLFSLGEDGSFAELELTPTEPKILQKSRLFSATESWTPPVLSNGLLYIVQNSKGFDGSPRRLICYDFRAHSK